MRISDWSSDVCSSDLSHNIRSFYLQAADGAGVPRFDAGQHLPVRILLEGQKAPSIRTYSVSSAPSDDFLRISVKRDGLVSAHLHDQIQVRSEERRVWKECVSTCRSRWSPNN